MAEDYTSSNIIHKGNKGYIVFTRDGSRKADTDYSKAFDSFANTGRQPKGFVVLDATSQEAKFRDAFNRVSQPVQSAVSATGKLLGRLGVATGTQMSGSPASINPRQGGLLPGGPTPAGQTTPAGDFRLQTAPSTQAGIQTGGQVGQAAAENIINPMIATPEAAALTGGTAAATAATAGTAGLIPFLIRTGTAGASYLAGQELTGSAEGRPTDRFMKPLYAVALSAGSEAGFGVIKSLFNLPTLKSKASQQIQSDVSDLMESRFPHLSRQGLSGIKAALGTSKGMHEATTLGVKALRGTTEEVMLETYDNIITTLPRALSTSSRDKFKSDITGYFDDYLTAANKILDNPKLDPADFKTSMDKAKQSIRIRVANEFEKAGKANVPLDNRIVSILNNFNKSDDDLRLGMVIVNNLKKSSTPEGFNSRRFQALMRDSYLSDPSEILDKATLAAARGKPITGIDYKLDKVSSARPSVNIPGLRRFGQLRLGVKVPVLDKFIGTVRGAAAQQQAQSAATARTITEFLKEE